MIKTFTRLITVKLFFILFMISLGHEAKAQNTLDKLSLTNATPATGAYGLRLLSGTYNGPLARITIGSNYYDVYPDATGNQIFSLTSPISAAYVNYNDEPTNATSNLLSSVAAGNNATVAIWYDQSGNANNATQGNTGTQPQIINAGIVDLERGLPTMVYSGAQWLNTSLTFERAAIPNAVVNAVYQNTIQSPSQALWGCDNGDWDRFQLLFFNGTGSPAYGLGNGAGGTSYAPATNNLSQNVYSAIMNYGTDNGNYVSENGVNSPTFTESLGDGSTDVLAIGAIGGYGGYPFIGNISEFTLFFSAMPTPTLQGLENNQTTYYNITPPVVPVATTTTPATNIAATTVTLAGNVSDDGGSAVTDKGIVYSASALPTIDLGTTVSSGAGTGTILANITNLTGSTTYHYRAYATNAVGTSYGSDQTFTTAVPPIPNILDKAGLSSNTPSSVAYSLRLLSSTYNGPLVRITLDNGTTYYDVYPDGSGNRTFSLSSPISAAYANYNDAATAVTSNLLGSIAAGNTATVAIWYDQSANGFNASQSDPSRQPRIINGGTVDTQNNLPSLYFNGNDYLNTISGFPINSDYTVSAVVDQTQNNGGSLIGSGPSGDHIFWYGGGNNISFWHNGGTFAMGPASPNNLLVAQLGAYVNGNSTGTTYTDGVAGSPQNGQSIIASNIQLGGYSNSYTLVGYFSEGIVFPSAFSDINNQTLLSNQTTYYSIAALTAPVVTTTTPATNVSSISATVGGNVSADGGTTVTDKGIVYGTGANPTLSTGTVVNNGSDIGGISVTLSEVLTASTTYHYQAYATNAVGTTYGGDQTFTTTAPPIPNYLDKLGLVGATPSATAYSLRLLSSTYAGPLARITVDGGATYYDVFPDATADKKFSLSSPISAAYNAYDATATASTGNALSTIVTGATTATVATWYDQSGNGNNALQGSVFNQPNVISAGVVYTESGKPSLRFLGSSNNYFQTSNNVRISGASSVSVVAQNINTDPNNAACIVTHTYNGNNMGFVLGHNSSGGGMSYAIFNGGWAGVQYNADFPTSPFVATGTYGENNLNLYINALAQATNTNAPGNLVASFPMRIARRWDTDDYFDGYIPELVVFASELSTSERQSAEGSQFTYYSIAAATAPTVTTTTPATNIKYASVTLAGNVSADGGSTVTDRGIVYSTTANPTIGAGTQISSGTGTGVFSVNITNLTASTIYHYQAYATNGVGTTYGGDQTFTTAAAPVPNILNNMGLGNGATSTAAYSLRLLSNTYAGPLARININGTYYDVYPDASTGQVFSLTSRISASYVNYNDGATGATSNLLSSVIGNNSATVAIWYDQSGFSFDASQSDSNIQPEVINAGVVDNSNNLPSVYFNGSTYLASPGGFPTNSDYTVSVVVNQTTGSTGNVFGSAGGHTFWYSQSTNINLWHGGNFASGPSIPYNQLAAQAGEFINGTGTGITYSNGIAGTPGNTGNMVSDPTIELGAYGGGNNLIGYISEGLAFPSALIDADRQTLQANQGTYYNIIIQGPPTVTTTSPATNINKTTATLTGNVTADGGSAITDEGIVYGNTAAPTLATGTTISAGVTTLGAFSANITGLIPGITYHYQAYATNGAGTVYGGDQTFTTTPGAALDKMGLTTATPATGAYSLRLLSSSYTGPLARIRVNNNYYDVYPDASNSNILSVSSPISAAYVNYNDAVTSATANLLSSLIAGNTATVATWYDQSGLGYDGIQGDPNLQPEIFNAGVIDVSNGKPAIKFSGSNYLIVTGTAFDNDLSGSVVFNATNSNSTSGGNNTWYIMNGIFGSEQPGGTTDFGYGIYNNVFTAGNGSNDNSIGSNTSVNDSQTRENSWTRSNSSGSINLFSNASADGSASLNAGTRAAVPSIAIGSITTNGGGNFYGTISEMTLFPLVYSDAQRQTIEGNQITYYHIGNITTPTVTTTTPATSLGMTTATLAGNVSDNGGDVLTDEGIIYAATANPTIGTGTQVSSNSTITGAFSSSITGLTIGTTYHYQAYATNSLGTTYGGDQTFTTINLTTPTITFNTLPAVTFGDADFDPAASSNNTAVPVTYTSDNTNVATIVDGLVHIVGKGTANITANQVADNTHTTATAIQALSVSAKNIAVVAVVQSKTFGDPDPTNFTYTTTGTLVGSDIFSGSLTRVAGEDAGSYAIQQGSLALSGNYIITYTPVQFTINKATFTGITLADATITYDGTPKSLVVTGLPIGATVVYTNNSQTNVGTYAVSAVVSKTNYADQTLTGTLTIANAAGTATLAGASFVYDGTPKSLAVTNLPVGATVTYTGNGQTNVGAYNVTAVINQLNHADQTLTATLTITPVTISTLANLSINSGALSPAFAPGTGNYTASVANTVTIVRLTPTAANAIETIKVNGTAVASGAASGNINLQIGTNVITTLVTAQDGSTISSYAVTVTRAPSTVAYLGGLSISDGTLSPIFGYNINSYTAQVGNNITSLTLLPSALDPTATITINGTTAVTNQTSNPISLNVGSNIITIVVTAQDGSTTQTYTLVIDRGIAPAAITATNILSPDGDGKNDTWIIKDLALYPNNTVTIYDRAGRVIYSKHNYGNDWGGTFQGAPLAEDTYYYTVDLGPGLPLVKGFITILRNRR